MIQPHVDNLLRRRRPGRMQLGPPVTEAGPHMLMRRVLVSAMFWALLAAAGSALAQAPDNEPPVDFGRQIQPILVKRCFKCHGPDKDEAGLRLHERAAATAELESGERAIVPGDVEHSELLKRITASDDDVRMPPESKPLPPEEIALVRRWIAEGARWEAHWAFQPVTRPPVPAAKHADWPANPIDAFVLARLETAGLQPAPPADRVALARRVYYDLTGLPPTPEEVDAFVADPSPTAYEELVDRLLASPHYGEHWARHWLDAVRYADTNSFERDGAKPNAWRYRDYVIRALNDDKPYDQFIREQLAGDELDEVTTDSIIATAYYRLGIWDDEPVDGLQARYDELDDILRVTGEVFLGVTIGCARCHDHKIDPMPQTDYYRMLAFFQGLTTYGTRDDQTGNNQVEITPPEVRAEYARLEGQLQAARQQVARIEQQGIARMPEEDRRRIEQAKGDERRKLLDEKLGAFLQEPEQNQRAALVERARQSEQDRAKLPPRQFTLAVARCNATPAPAHVLQRGNTHAPAQEVEPGFPVLFSAPDPQLPAPSQGARSSKRRRVLAEWIASPDNRLTARVMANRVWQHHFGRGIVRSPNNFGLLGDRPTHPELLDWLAGELVRGGWRLKPLHRLIVTSNTYRMASHGSADGLARDPDNNLFWRFNMRRLSAEEIRDSLNVVTSLFNDKMFGPGYFAEISPEVLAGQSMPGHGWGNSPPAEQARRSIYIHVKRSLVTPLLADFDFPDTDTSCAARFATTQPGQALGMLNGKLLNDQAHALAARLRREVGDEPRRQVTRALRLALGHSPDEASIERGLKLIESLQQKHNVPADRALNFYCLMVLNLNEFLYLD